MIKVTEHLASFFNRKDEEPNIRLAHDIADRSDTQAVRDLMDLLKEGKRDQQSDCIKVLCEIGKRQPALIAPYFNDFLQTLKSKNNRLQWGAMTALDAIALENPDLTVAHLGEILNASEHGSVITKDHAVGILIRLCSVAKHQEVAFPLLLEQLRTCATNQLPMYAEQVLAVIDGEWKQRFAYALLKRTPEMDKESKLRRLRLVIQKLEK